MKKKCRHVKAIIQFRRATEREWVEVNPILRAGEPALSTDVMKVKVGDGIHNWLSLDYIDRSGGDSVDFIYTTEGLTGQENRLYINKTDGTALIWNGEGFEELESSSIEDLKDRLDTVESDIEEIREYGIYEAGNGIIINNHTIALDNLILDCGTSTTNI